MAYKSYKSMSKTQSFIASFLCGKKKQPKVKKHDEIQQPNSLCTFHEFITSNINVETQTPANFDNTLKSSFSLPQLSNTCSSPTNRKSTIAVKKSSGGFFPQLNKQKYETIRSDWSTSSSNNWLNSFEFTGEPVMSNNTFSELFKSNKEPITWSKKYSQETPSNKFNDPFISSDEKKMPKIIPITPRQINRARPFVRNIQLKKEINKSNSMPAVAQEKSRLQLNLIVDVYEGESSNSLVNL
ncbi:unnamed protein product [Blepharisma stoltei]|uniref:Uncharacterized protein n=1 Tax=Blepharisma stoltei TaxID=1481888 RepID=A0AAU9ILC4_9CILI|nr:unnamed protein product [Blepharisma stoltei]